MNRRIETLQRLSASSPLTIAFAGGLPAPELFPRAGVTAGFLSAIDAPACPALQYGWPEGDPELREWVARRLRARGADVAAHDVIITSGAQQAISIATELVVPAAAGRVGVDELSYPAALDVFRARAAELVEGASDGMDCVYAMPGVANPCGNPLSASRRASLVAAGSPIIADEAYAELRFDGKTERPLLADARERVWHVGTLSKTLCPGFRVGWLVPPRHSLAQAVHAKHDRDLQAGSLSQEVVRNFLAHDDFDTRLARARTFYRRRADRLLRALRRRFGAWHIYEPVGGFSVFLESDIEGDDADLLSIALMHGVSFDPGRLFRPSNESRRLGMRVCFSAVPPTMMEEGVARLERAVVAFVAR